MDTLLDRTIQFVDVSFGQKKPHFERTLYWILQLKPDATEAMQIAAYAHDIDRAFNLNTSLQTVQNSADGTRDPAYLLAHQNGGAEIMRKFLQEQYAASDTIEVVAHLISKHEVGGDDGQNLLKDADSISFFECNSDDFAKRYIPIMGYEKVQDKFNWMFSRITSDQAKTIAQPMYQNALVKLEQFKPAGTP